MKQSGFTLIELMVVVAIIAILATIAYASYQDQIVKSRRAAGAACLQEKAQYMERYYTTNMTYEGAAFGQCDADVAPFYTIEEVGDATAKAFTLQATAQASQGNDAKCGNLRIDEKGTRTVTGTSSATPQDCW